MQVHVNNFTNHIAPCLFVVLILDAASSRVLCRVVIKGLPNHLIVLKFTAIAIAMNSWQLFTPTFPGTMASFRVVTRLQIEDIVHRYSRTMCW